MLPFVRRRVHFIPQLEATECGAACLAMVLDYHGAPAPLAEVREACAVSRDGVNAGTIARAAETYGLEAIGYKLELEELAEIALPAILHWEMRHFVVLERITNKRMHIVDPALGRRSIPRAAFSEAFTGVALALAPTARIRRRRRRSGSFARYRDVLVAHKGALTMLLGTGLLLELVATLLPAANQVLIDHVIGAQRKSFTLPLIVALTVGSLVMITLGFLRDRLIRRLSFVVDTALASAFTEHMARLPIGFFQQRSQGDLMERVGAQRQVREVLVRALTASLDALIVCTYGALMLAYHTRLGAFVIGLSALRGLWLWLARPRVEEALAAELVLRGKELAAQVETFASPEALKAFAMEDAMQQRFESCLVARLHAGVTRERTSAVVNHGSALFDVVAQALVLWIGGTAVITHELTLGAFASFVVLQRLFQKPVQALVEATGQLAYVRVALARIDDVLETRPQRSGRRSIARVESEIVFDRVSFRYGPSSPWIVRDLSLTIRAGEQLAIVGRSGQGKSSLMSLLLGLVQPTEGVIYVDGVPLSELDSKAYLACIGVVLQEPYLLDDSVRTNLTFHAPDVSDQALQEAARLACIDEVIGALPQGYDTRLGRGGARLSGGQRQRLGLARALCTKPSLLLLDEATSALDAELESRVHHNLSVLGCTRIAIAHRLSTVRDADRIVVLEGGQIVQQGRYAQLVRQPGLFSEMARC